MRATDFEQLIIAAHKHERELRAAAQKEYARTEEDALANFKRVGKLLDLPPEKVLLVYFLKHVDGIIAHCEGHEAQREPISGRIYDARLYLLLLQGLLEEKE